MELIVSNIESTDVTVVLEVTEVAKVREEGLVSRAIRRVENLRSRRAGM